LSFWTSHPVSAAYVHIPFCVRKCTYCDFISFACNDRNKHQAYVDALLNEISSAAAFYRKSCPALLRPLQSLFFGGGTPTVPEPRQIVRILTHLRRTFGLAPDCECTIEANPGTVTLDRLELYRSAGINRLSFGLQAIQPHLLSLLGRIHTAGDFRTNVLAARDAGFTNISADILIGLPRQTLRDVRQTVAEICSLPLTHLSFYSLILEEGTPLAAAHDAGKIVLPTEASERAQYHLVRRSLAASGFSQYEISNSARPGYTCRHNQVYWQALPYWGFGVAAHSYVAGIRSGNTTNLDHYLCLFGPARPGDAHQIPCAADTAVPADWQTARPAATVTEIIDRAEAMREMMLLGLRLTEGVRDSDFRERFSESLFSVFSAEIDQLSRQGLIVKNHDRIRLSLRGLDLANQAFRLFVG